MVTRPRLTRRQMRGQWGLTLVEVIVSIAILAVIGGVVAAIYQVGLKAVASSGPQGRLLGAHDLEILEDSLGRDGARAACFQAAGVRYGSCSNGFLTVANALTKGVQNCPLSSTSLLCIGWAQTDSSCGTDDCSCHVATYLVGPGSPPGAGVKATRSEYKAVGAAASLVQSVRLATEVPVTITVASPLTLTPSGETYSWVRSLKITITSVAGTNPPSQALTLQPVATDPAGANAALSGGVLPC